MVDLDESKRIPELPLRGILMGNALFALYFPDTDTTYRFPASAVIPESGSSNYAWQDDITYSAGQIVGHLDDLWVSNAGGNLGNAPGPASAFWTLGVAGVSGLVPWAASIFTKQYVTVIYQSRIWFLNSLTRPYNSTNIDTEIAAGDWIELSADLISKAVDTSGASFSMDIAGVKEVVFIASHDFAGSKTIASILNSTNAIRFEFIFKITTLDPHTLPAGSRMMNAGDEWNDTTKVWTPVDIGVYKMRFTKYGSDWLIDQLATWIY
jgi:hypothetical protein